MTRHSSLYLLLIALLTMLAGCNDDEINTGEVSYQSVAVKGFNLQKDDSVLVNLDSVFFSIDLVERRIFNADSLPKGTKIDRLLVKVSTDMSRNVEIIQPRGNGLSDTTINLLNTPNDSIDFSHGPVTLRITSYDGTAVANYELKVNVHQTEPDTLCWSRLAQADVPTTLSSVTASRIVKQGDNVVVMASNGSAATVAVTTDPAVGSWKISDAAVPAGADINTLAASDNALYLIAGKMLYRSTDLGLIWNSTGTAMTWIYGICDNEVVGCDADSRTSITYPSGVTAAIPSGMPVTATSSMVTFDTKWSTSSVSMFVGGRTADGSLSRYTWGWDGQAWAALNNNLAIPPIEGATLFSYYTYNVNSTSWIITRQEALFLIGGRTADGFTKKVYLSTDQGYTWKLAGSLMQLPDFMPKVAGASAVVCSTMMSLETPSVRSGSAWTEMPLSIPAWFELESAPDTRVSKPVTEWECPYIYLTGGTTEDNRAMTQMWRGVVNRLRFNPRY